MTKTLYIAAIALGIAFDASAQTADPFLTIFFDRDPAVVAETLAASSACQLTEGGEELVKEAAYEWRTNPQQEFVVYGHNDTAESKELSLLISACRAIAVSELAQERGVNPAKIFIYALGENSLKSPTEDGVTDPLNRRAEVYLFAPASNAEGGAD